MAKYMVIYRGETMTPLDSRLVEHLESCASCRTSVLVHMGYGEVLLHAAIKAYNSGKPDNGSAP